MTSKGRASSSDAYIAATTRGLPPGWNESHLEAYRDGYTDALLWALEHDHDEIVAVLDDE